MLYSAEKGNNTSFRGRVWQLTNRQWRACNYNGQQCNFKLYNEALRFSLKGKPINEDEDVDDEDVDETVYDDEHRTGKYISDGLKRQQTRYRPELSRSEMERLVKNLKDQGYKATAKGPNLKTDATDKAIDMAEGARQPGRRVSGKAPKSMPDRSAFDAIKPGSRVTIKTPQGQTRRGKAVMYNRQHDAWVLNMGGRHGTPGVVTRDNFVSLGGGGGKMNRLSDRPRTEGGAGSGPQKGGEERSYKTWRTAADQPSSDDRKLRRLKKKYDLEKTKKYEETNRINEGPMPPGLIDGKSVTVTSIRDLTYPASGLRVPKGTTIQLFFSKTRPELAYFQYGEGWKATRLQVAHKNWKGISKPPSMAQLQKMDDAGVAKSVTGKRVEPDGYGPDGSPSWLLVLGMI